MARLRITAGSLRGRRVTVPPNDVRPTSERARQAYFNIAGGRIAGAHFLDLFAGSGVFAIEAVSRGAAAATAVESDKHAAAAIANLAKAWAMPLNVVTDDAIAAIPRLGDVYDLVYADPPYGYDAYDELLVAIDDRLKLRNDALVAIEHRKRTDPFRGGQALMPVPPDERGQARVPVLHRLRFLRRAEYGEVWITFFTKTVENG
jgi:16S rRNA (guanine966-N2)-methyltransferase